jgi:hypothetical protein
MSASPEQIVRPASSAAGRPIPGMVTKIGEPVLIHAMSSAGQFRSFVGELSINSTIYNIKYPKEKIST